MWLFVLSINQYLCTSVITPVNIIGGALPFIGLRGLRIYIYIYIYIYILMQYIAILFGTDKATKYTHRYFNKYDGKNAS